MEYSDYFNKQLETQREINKSIVDKFKEIEEVIRDNNKDIYNKLEIQENEIKDLKLKLETIPTSSWYPKQSLYYIASHLFYGFLLYEGIYFTSKIIMMTCI